MSGFIGGSSSGSSTTPISGDVYISYSTGSDSNSGDATHPLKTVAGLRAKCGGQVTSGTNIYLMDVQAGEVFSGLWEEVGTGNDRVLIQGVYTYGQSGTVSSYTPEVTTHGSASQAIINLSGAVISNFSRITVYAPDLSVRCKLAIISNTSGTNYKVSSLGGVDIPNAGDTYKVTSFDVSVDFNAVFAGQFNIDNVKITNLSASSNTSAADPTNVADQTSGLCLSNCNLTSLLTDCTKCSINSCIIDFQSYSVVKNPTFYISDTLIMNNLLACFGGTVLFSGVSFYMSGLDFSGTTCKVDFDINFFNCNTCMYLNNRTSFLCYNTIYGNTNTKGMILRNGSIASLICSNMFLSATQEVNISSKTSVVKFTSGIPSGAALSCATFALVQSNFAGAAIDLPTMTGIVVHTN